ncbi:MAG: YggS family pyridoxal phosphate-dependent enzyme [Acidobacteria bacterium]|nr:YggS family pyridoxal phosphate-dependent enzyme [Acidobacteriota bacterium]
MSIATRVHEVRRRIAGAAERAGRDPRSVTLVAVGKTHTAEAIIEALRAGVTDLGENRVAEAASKKPHIPPATWHLIGPLQRNKARLALDVFDIIETVDRPALVERLAALLETHWPDRRLPVLVEVNVGGEPQKAGVSPAGAASVAQEVLHHPQLDLRGLMTVPPLGAGAESARPFFRELATLAEDLRQQLGVPLPWLSMGMSHDFEIAVEEGATHVRVGTAIFGPREAQ